MKYKLNFSAENDTVIIPSKREGDAAYDIYANFEQDNLVIMPHETKLIPTGLRSSFSKDLVVILKERGSTGSKGMGVRMGVIDSNFRGVWQVGITNHNEKPIVITKEEKTEALEDDYIVYPYNKAICQAVVLQLPEVEVSAVPVEVIKNDTTERGEGMLGSSNK